ncbi:Multidrug resistance-associated protein 1 [Clonorchis sinensis]|uniref:Multidrug resistance-associated protein 1 n=2 Tax=Clonorchis sinensis TaxID=79923 RepID=A0A8T1M9U9_CLOSI|nr:Multidrug resistance-associated protein 1 [Clonorchis sinensis]
MDILERELYVENYLARFYSLFSSYLAGVAYDGVFSHRTSAAYFDHAYLQTTAPNQQYSLCTRTADQAGKCARVPDVDFGKLLLLFTVISLLLEIIRTAIHVPNEQITRTTVVILINCLVRSVFLVALSFSTYQEYRRNVATSGILFTFWLLETLLCAIHFQTTIRMCVLQTHPDYLQLVSVTIRFLSSLGLLVAHCFAGVEDDASTTGRYSPTEAAGFTLLQDKPICPEEKSSFPLRLTFLWFTSAVIEGCKRPTTFDDLWRLNPRYMSTYLIARAERFWNSLLAQKLKKLGKERYERLPAAETDFQVPPKGYQPSLFATFVRTFWRIFFTGFIIRFAGDALSFVQPLVISELITFVQISQPANFSHNPDETEPTSVVYEWHGYFFAVVLPLIGFIRTILFQQQFHYAYVLGMNMRVTAAGLVYRKALRLSQSSRQTATVGEIVNLMAIDSQRLEEAGVMIHMAWSAPPIILVSLVMVYSQMGWSALAGFGLTVLLIPINVAVASKAKMYQQQLMLVKDDRIKLLNQTFVGIKVLKMYAWELAFQDRITKLRDKEVNLIRKMAYLRSVNSVTAFCAPILISLTTFGAYVLSSADHVLDARRVFVSLSLFNIMAFPLAMLPNLVAVVVQAAIAFRRIQKFLLMPELQFQQRALEYTATVENQRDIEEPAIFVSEATFGWDSETVMFNNLNISLSKGSFSVIIGAVGAGKSSLISTILGELYRYRGTVRTQGSIAYVPQQAWCLNTTVQENILFGQLMDRPFYERVLRCCCLTDDLEQFPNGDLTEIGERGINLSGGQKQRISLARAVYQRADIYLLDDPLSAVDAHVANALFSQVIGPQGLLNQTTRLLVTHRLINLAQADQIFTICRSSSPRVALGDLGIGQDNPAYQTIDFNDDSGLGFASESYIGEIGTLAELMGHNGPFAEYMRQYLAEHQDTGKEQESPQKQYETDENGDFGTFVVQPDQLSLHDCESLAASSEFTSQQDTELNKLLSGRLVVQEHEETGRIAFSVLSAYRSAYGNLPTLLTLVSYILFIASVIGSNVWLSYWSQSGSSSDSKAEDKTWERNYYLGVYGAIGIAQSVFTLVKVLALAYGSSRASKVLHLKLLENILRASCTFFDTTPSGRIVNRFSRDIDSADLTIPMSLRILLITVADLVSSLVLIAISIPWFLLVLIPISTAFTGIYMLYVRTNRQLKRIDSVRRSPIFSHFQETLMGAASIRAYNRVQQFIEKCDSLLDESQMARYPCLVCYRWLGVVVEFVGHFITLFVCLFVVGTRASIGSGFAGLAITFTLRISNSLTFIIRTLADLEAEFVSVERIIEYTKVPQEAPWTLPSENLLPQNWPTVGEVVFDRYSTRYRPGLDLVLRNINFRVNGGERVGIVGRTGAGKSSLTGALFRLIESVDGRILIDGMDIHQMGLHDVRKNLTIIPQEPVLFSGSLRFNLDPAGNWSDDELWNALEHAHLKDYFLEQRDQLDFECSEGGENLSVGQRQLVCLARALLEHNQILILDEATAAVDMRTDELIQNTIRTKFAGHTILTIAHRLDTVMNYDKILILSQGSVVEYDTPDSLLANKDSTFSQMARDANLI